MDYNHDKQLRYLHAGHFDAYGGPLLRNFIKPSQVRKLVHGCQFLYTQHSSDHRVAVREKDQESLTEQLADEVSRQHLEEL